MNEPSYQLASKAQQFWAQYHNPSQTILYVGGQEPAAYYLAAYLPTHPVFFKDNNFTQSPWVNKNNFLKNGALFIDPGCHQKSNHYQSWNVIAKKCIWVDQANKFWPRKLPFTLYVTASDIK